MIGLQEPRLIHCSVGAIAYFMLKIATYSFLFSSMGRFWLLDQSFSLAFEVFKHCCRLRCSLIFLNKHKLE